MVIIEYSYFEWLTCLFFSCSFLFVSAVISPVAIYRTLASFMVSPMLTELCWFAKLPGYDGSVSEWDDYPRYVNPDGVEITPVS